MKYFQFYIKIKQYNLFFVYVILINSLTNKSEKNSYSMKNNTYTCHIHNIKAFVN